MTTSCNEQARQHDRHETYCKAPLGHRGDQAVVCKSHRVRIQKRRLLSSQYFIILGTPHVYTRGAAGQIMELFGIDAVVSLGATASAQNRYSKQISRAMLNTSVTFIYCMVDSR